MNIYQNPHITDIRNFAGNMLKYDGIWLTARYAEQKPSSFVQAGDLESTRYITHTCTIVSPTWDLDTTYVVTTYNHSALPDIK
jgi:hypothetical protein